VKDGQAVGIFFIKKEDRIKIPMKE